MNYFDENTYKNILNQLCIMSGIDSDKLNDKLHNDPEFASLFFVVMNRYKINCLRIHESLKIKDNKSIIDKRNSEMILKKSRKIRELYLHAITQIEKIK